MKHLFQYSTLFLLSLLALSCNLQSQSGQEDKVVGETHSPVDPFFQGHEQASPSNGPNSITRNIRQDRHGDIWFASYEGIMRFDGKTFTNITTQQGFEQYRVFAVFEDSKGIVWLGTLGGGVYRFDRKAAENGGSGFTILTTEDGLVSDVVSCFCETEDGKLWIGTQHGLSCYDGKTFRNYTMADGLPDEDVNAIAQTVDGDLWIGARGAAGVFDGSGFKYLHRAGGEAFYNTRTVIRDRDGNMWLGGNSGLWRHDGANFQQYDKNFVGNLYQDGEGDLWLSRSWPNDLYQMSLYRIDGSALASPSAEAELVANPPGQVFGMIKDAAGNIWFGTERGAYRFDGEEFENFHE